jgi:hypothetical protein
MGATLQLLSQGRFVMGLGTGWYENDYTAFGYDFPEKPADRIAQLEETIQIIRRMWTETPVTFEGKYYRVNAAFCEPKPEPVPPILIGGGGEKLMLRLVAKYADWWNYCDTAEAYGHKLDVLRAHCDAVGRDFKQIVKTWDGLQMTLAETEAEAWRIYEVSPFKRRGCIVGTPQQAAEQLKVPLKVLCVENDYLRMLRNPKHGYGKNLNPCVDCKIFILKKAKAYAKEIGADFLFTGEVLGERPMSQHGPALKTIAQEAGLKGQLLRPLSAKMLAETEAEKKGLVDRNRLLSIQGRSRKPQFALAKEYGITVYPSPAGGCLLTCEEYAKKLRDLLENKKRATMADVALLRFGRHFRSGKNKIIVGRNEAENKFLNSNKLAGDFVFESPDIVGPVSLLQGPKTKAAIETAAKLTAFYSDAKKRGISQVTVKYGRASLDKSAVVSLPLEPEVLKLRVGNST